MFIRIRMHPFPTDASAWTHDPRHNTRVAGTVTGRHLSLSSRADWDNEKQHEGPGAALTSNGEKHRHRSMQDDERSEQHEDAGTTAAG